MQLMSRPFQYRAGFPPLLHHFFLPFLLLVFLSILLNSSLYADISGRLSLKRDFVTFYALWVKKLDYISVSENYNEKTSVLTLFDSKKRVVARGKAEKRDEGYLFQGRWERFYPEGERLALLMYRDGKLNGRSRGYYKNRREALTAMYVNGYLHGERVRFDSSGRVLDRVTYKAGEIDKYRIVTMLVPSFQRPENIPAVAVFDSTEDVWIARDAKNQQIRMWYRNGKRLCEINVKNLSEESEVYHGLAIYWTRDGGRAMVGQYRDGKRHGMWTLYNSDGSIKERIRYINGEPEHS